MNWQWLAPRMTARQVADEFARTTFEDRQVDPDSFEVLLDRPATRFSLVDGRATYVMTADRKGLWTVQREEN